MHFLGMALCCSKQANGCLTLCAALSHFILSHYPVATNILEAFFCYCLWNLKTFGCWRIAACRCM